MIKKLECVKKKLAAQKIAFAYTTQPQPITAMYPEEREYVQGAVKKRQAEFATGRWCARVAMSELGIATMPIVVGDLGEPVFPSGVCGAISHADGIYCACVALKEHYRAVSIDIERLNRKVSETTLEIIFTDDERSALAEISSAIDAYAVKYLSAKECIYKLITPIIRKRVHLSEFAIEFDINSEIFTAVLQSDLSAEFYKGLKITGEFYEADLLFFTFAPLKV